MKITDRIGFALAGSLLLTAVMWAAAPPVTPRLVLRATYDTGLGIDGAEIVSIRHSDGLAVLSNASGSVDVLDLSNPLQPERLYRLEIDAVGTPNSVALHPHHDYFLVAIGTAGLQGVVEAHRLSDGALLASAAVGIQPDSIAIAPNGQHAVVANEAEGVGVGLHGGPGSISILDLGNFHDLLSGVLPVRNLALPSLSGMAGFSVGRTDDLARLAIDNTPNTLEPESVAFTGDSRYAYVTLQENNGVARVDVRTGAMTFVGLGQTMHAADLVVDGAYQPVNVLSAFHEPDGIAVDQTGRYFVVADEGDTRNAVGGSGPRGGRTVSLFDAETGAFMADTGRQIDDAAAAAGRYPDGRSNRGGSEPEVLDITEHKGFTLVAVTLERADAVALVNTSDPFAPVVIDVEAVGVGPEGVKFFRRGSRLFVASANEVSGTLSILEVLF
jgi:uncharacterized protein